MATTSLGTISSGALQESPAAVRAPSSSSFRTSGAQRAFLLAPGRSFRAFRTIKKASPRLSSKSPRLSRSVSRLVRVKAASSAIADPRASFAIAREEKEDDVMKNRLSGGGDDVVVVDDNNRFVDIANGVLADVVDGQKFIKETGRTKPRPMKRRALVVCFALGALRAPINDVERSLGTSTNLGRSATEARLARGPSSGFARTAHLISQLSFGAPKSPGGGSLVANNSLVEQL